jgi:DNA-binding PucR family transcriptional regulator
LMAGTGIARAGQTVDSALDDAVAALRTMQAIGARRGLFQYNNIEFYRMVASVHHAGGGQSTALSRALKALLAYDHEHNTDYTRTLRRYLTSEGNLSACAQKLYIHRHTLNNRLVKIEELCGVCLRDYPVRMQLGIELMLLDLFDTAAPA